MAGGGGGGTATTSQQQYRGRFSSDINTPPTSPSTHDQHSMNIHQKARSRSRERSSRSQTRMQQQQSQFTSSASSNASSTGSVDSTFHSQSSSPMTLSSSSTGSPNRTRATSSSRTPAPLGFLQQFQMFGRRDSSDHGTLTPSAAMHSNPTTVNALRHSADLPSRSRADYTNNSLTTPTARTSSSSSSGNSNSTTTTGAGASGNGANANSKDRYSGSSFSSSGSTNSSRSVSMDLSSPRINRGRLGSSAPKPMFLNTSTGTAPLASSSSSPLATTSGPVLPNGGNNNTAQLNGVPIDPINTNPASILAMQNMQTAIDLLEELQKVYSTSTLAVVPASTGGENGNGGLATVPEQQGLENEDVGKNDQGRPFSINALDALDLLQQHLGSPTTPKASTAPPGLSSKPSITSMNVNVNVVEVSQTFTTSTTTTTGAGVVNGGGNGIGSASPPALRRSRSAHYTSMSSSTKTFEIDPSTLSSYPIPIPPVLQSHQH
ncbi:hypothetical protein HDU76_007491 [Blyttiomyces sp. JEL0837]|nr:hypothetical protein HDU76_007491 [Blyttiomyces sp. JEL0837]